MFFFRVFCITLLLALTPQTVFAQNEALRAVLEEFIAEENIAGAAFWGHVDGEDISVTVGVANAENDTPITEHTRFYIASSGKMMVAAAILSQVADGKLNLDAPIWPLIANIDNIQQLQNASKVTLRQVLNHTSGLAEYLGDSFFEESLSQPNKRWTPNEALAFAFGEPANSPPGTSFEYTNTNYVLLGHILAQIDGSLAAALEKRIFAKADMRHSSIGASASEPNLAHGYDLYGDDMSAIAWASTLGDGPVVATAADVGKFMQALFRDQHILGPKMLAQMLSGSQQDASYGLGMGIDQDDWGDWYGHAGSYDGYEALVRYYADTDNVLVLLMNGNPQAPDELLDYAAEILFQN